MQLQYNDYKDLINLEKYPHFQEEIDIYEKEELCDTILKYLLKERGLISKLTFSYQDKRNIMRGYFNQRPPMALPKDILECQDKLLWSDTLEKGIIKIQDFEFNHQISLWQGDITQICADAIVNAANCELLGCFIPNHNCIDNVIHSAAGVQVRLDCSKIMEKQGNSESVGQVKVTGAYNLPSSYIFHTVGPMVGNKVTPIESAQLRSCYLSCLEQAKLMNLTSIVFPCISTGVFNFPQEEAGKIAVRTVVGWLKKNPESCLKIIFNVFLDKDKMIYQEILKDL